MNMRSIVFLLLLFALPVFARKSTDVVIMKNGDRWTCEIKALDADVLYVSLDYVDGTVSVNWSQVARIESTQPFIVRTANGSVYTGVLKTATTPANAPVMLKVVQDGSNVELERSRVVELDQTSLDFWRRFNGKLSWGMTYSKGNNATQYNINSDIAYLRESWSVGASYTSNLSANSGSTTTTRNEVTVEGQHLLPWKNYFCSALADFLQSSTQGIDRETTLGGGLGRYLKRSDRIAWTIIGGAVWQSTTYQPVVISEPQQNLAAAMIATRLQVFKFKKTNLDLSAYLFPMISEPGRVKFNTDASYYLKLFSNFNWNISFYGNWDNRPPQTFSGSDYGTSSGISWSFGSR